VPVGDVSVTATRAARDVLDTAGNVTVIDREHIERSGLRDVAELLRREAGLFVTNTTTNPEGYGVEARGFNDGGGQGSSLLVLVDGRRVNEAESSTTDWSWLRLDNVERIEIVRGPASSVWGDGAVAGVVHIITRATEGPWLVRFLGRTGHDDSDGASLFASASHGPASGSLYFDWVQTDGYRDQSDFEAHRYEGKWRLLVGEDLLLGLSAGYSSDQRERPGAITDEEIDRLSRRAAAPGTEGDELGLRRHHVEGLVEWLPTEGLLLSVVPWFNEKKHAGTITFPGSFTSEQRTEADSIGLNTKVQWDRSLWGMQNRMLVGFDLLHDDVHLTTEDSGPGFSAETRRDALRHFYGGFLQNELSLTERLLLSAGVRYDYGRLRGKDRLAGDAAYRTKTTIWSPKAALSYRVLEFASVYASWGKGFRFPNLDEAFGLFGFFPEGLDPEKSTNYEIGLKVRHQRGALNVAVYRLDVDEQIFFDHEIPCVPSPANFFFCFGTNDPRTVNFPRIQHRGLELSFDVRPIERIELYGSYTLDDTKIKSDRITSLEGSRLPMTPRHRGTFGFAAQLPFWTELRANGNFVGSRYLANDVANEQEKLPFFMTWDLTLALAPPVRDWLTLDLRLNVRNVFDREYSEFGGERTFVVPGRDNVAFDPSPERTMEVIVGFTAPL
jgi:iron complex outermembrane receptor protein